MTYLRLIVDVMRNETASIGLTDDEIADRVLDSLANQGFDIGIQYAER